MSGGARRGSPASSALSLLLLVAPLLAFAPAALASVPRGATALPSPLLAADVDVLAKSSLEHNDRAPFRVFAGDELGAAHVLVFELSYPETRVGGLGLPDEARVGAERSLRLEAPWACDERSPRGATGSGEFRIFDPTGTSRSASAFGWNRLFQGREHLGFVDAYDFRARTLWPEIGRFGQEDPIGVVDSSNLYQFGGASFLRSDPFGLKYTEAARLERRILEYDMVRFTATAADSLRPVVGVHSVRSSEISNPNDPYYRSLPEVASLGYAFEEQVLDGREGDWDGFVYQELLERFESFDRAWAAADVGRGDNVYFVEDAGRFALFGRARFERDVVVGAVGEAVMNFAFGMHEGARARAGNAGYRIGPAPRLNGNSLQNPLDTHVYAIYGPDGLWKIGESGQGTRVRDGKSKRAEKQVRDLGKKTGQRFESFILREFSGKAAGRAYETQLIQRYTRRFGRPPGNPLDR